VPRGRHRRYDAWKAAAAKLARAIAGACRHAR
jgi:hypothetical protein